MPVIIGGAESGKKKAKEKERPGNAFAGISKQTCGPWAEKECQSHDAEDREGKIGNDVAEVGDAKPGTLVGEVVEFERLRDARDKWNGRKKKNS